MTYTRYKLEEIAIFNKQTIKKSDGISHIEYLDTSSITENFISGTTYMSVEEAPSRAQRRVEDKTIIYSTVRPRLKHYGILTNPQGNLIVSTGFATIDIKEEYKGIVDARYLYLLITQPAITEYIGSIADTAVSAYPSINPSDLQSLSFDFPDISVQQQIANIWENYDKKIALNRQINDNLEAMAKQLYDYWFVQFDFPNEEGKPYKSSGGKMVWNDKLKREIPEGWEVKSINDLSTICRGVSYKPSDLQDNGVLILRGNNIENNRIIYDNNTAFLSPNLISAEQKIKRHDIIITMSSGSKEHIGKCAMFQLDSGHSFGAFLSKITPNKDCPHFIFLFLSSTYFKQKIKSVCNGTGINNLTNQTFDEVKFAYPTPNTLKLFERRIQSIFGTIGNNDAENEVLTKQRDELLPLLMNGQVSVNYHLSHD